MNTKDHTTDHLEYLMAAGWHLTLGPTIRHILTRPGAYIVIEPVGIMQLFQFDELKGCYEYVKEYWDTRPLPVEKFAQLCDAMGIADRETTLAKVIGF